MMHAQALDKFVKKPVKDTYGRDLGHAIGFSLDSSGNMKGLGVDHGTGSFQEYSHERIIIDGKSETIILLPEWREDVDKLKKNTLTAKKRTKVLEDLRLEGEIPEHAFQDLKQNYENEIDKLKSSSISIVEKLQNRIDNIEKSRLETEKFLSTLKVQYRTDEIDRETFHRASESTVDMMDKDNVEKAEISQILNFLSVDENTQETPSVSHVFQSDEPDSGLLMESEIFTEAEPHPFVTPEPTPIMEEPTPEPTPAIAKPETYSLFSESEMPDPLITKITEFANNHPDLSPIEDNSFNNPTKSIPKSEKTETGWKISFE